MKNPQNILEEAKTVSINTAAKAILPGNQEVSREQILSRLGLNPSTAPEAWLAVVGCGSNASALQLGEAQELLASKKLTPAHFDASVLKKIQPK